MGRHAIPDRWLDFKPIGKQIEGTRFIAFKVPLRKNVNGLVAETNLRLDADMLMEQIPNLGLIIDLTNTNRYYSPEFFTNFGVKHQKLMVPGKETPSNKLATEFKFYVMNFLNLNQDNDKLIGVHCTHGVNRTGYLICNYMISEMRMAPKEAIQKFISARGHQIERENYVQALHNLNKMKELEVEEKHPRKQHQQQHNNTSRSLETQRQRGGGNLRRDDAVFGIYRSNDERSYNNFSDSKSSKYSFNAFKSKGDDESNRYRTSDRTSTGYSFNSRESANAFRSNGGDGGSHRYRNGGSSAGYSINLNAESSNAFRKNGDYGSHSFRRGAVANSSWRSTATNAGNKFKGGEPSNAFRGGEPSNAFKGGKPSNAFRGNEPSNAFKGGKPSNAFRGGEPSNAFRGGEPSNAFRGGNPRYNHHTSYDGSFNKFKSNNDRKKGDPVSTRNGIPKI